MNAAFNVNFCVVRKAQYKIQCICITGAQTTAGMEFI